MAIAPRVKKNPPRKVTVEVVKVAAEPSGETCSCFTEGQVFTFDFERCPQDFCAAAFHSIWPMIRVVELRGRHPWDAEEGITFACCPDHAKPVTFKITAVEPSEEK